MSKRLKRRIFDICGLTNLSREDKVRKANAILADSDLKQKVCNQIMGASHKDIEKALKAVAATKASSEEDEEAAELERDYPEKLDPDIKLGRKVKPLRLMAITNQREINELISATNEPLVDRTEAISPNYSSYSEDEIREWAMKMTE